MCHGAAVCSTAVTQFRDFFTTTTSAGSKRTRTRQARLAEHAAPKSHTRFSACQPAITSNRMHPLGRSGLHYQTLCWCVTLKLPDKLKEDIIFLPVIQQQAASSQRSHRCVKVQRCHVCPTQMVCMDCIHKALVPHPLRSSVCERSQGAATTLQQKQTELHLDSFQGLKWTQEGLFWNILMQINK